MTNSVPPYILTQENVAIVINGKRLTANSDHINWPEIVEAIRGERWNDLPNLFDAVATVKEYVAFGSDFSVEDETVLMNGEPVHGTIVERILDRMREGFDVTLLVNFLRRLLKNPSRKTIDELYDFMEYGKMTITADGCFLAYKRVNSNYTSVYDGTTLNAIGTVVSMPRREVDDRSDVVCSTGLHFCSHEYLKSFSGDKVVILKVDPEHVVSIPTDYNNTKGRACQYEVVGELSPEEVEEALSQELTAERFGSFFADVLNDLADEDNEYDDWSDEEYDGIEEDEYEKQAHQYDLGYTDGRAKRSKMFDDYAYLEGYKDGRGHKAKKYL